MNLLALSTSSPLLSIALQKGKEPVVQTTVRGFFKHAENILPAIDKLLKKKKLTMDKVDMFLIDRGPGSFTGLRVGFATLKGFLALKSKPCLGALSLDLIAQNISLPEKSELAVCLDAHRARLYVRKYRRIKDSWQPLGDAETLPVETVLASLPKKIHVTGNALDRYTDAFKAARSFELLPEKFWYPQAKTLLSLMSSLRKRGSSSLKSLDSRFRGNDKITQLIAPSDFIPLYFRMSEAEERRSEHASAH